MKKYNILAALGFALISTSAQADGISCPEMAKIIADYEDKRQTGHMSENESLSIPSILAADYQSYYSGGCTESQLKQEVKPGQTFKSKKDVK